MTDVFVQLGVMLGIALVVSFIMKLLKQPLIIGYIITGIIVGPSVTGLIPHGGALESFSHIGVALLLFIVGLGLKPKVIKDVGKVALITGLAQIIFTTIGGFFIAKALGLDAIVSFYLSLGFALSSTIVILRLLYNKKEQDTLYGRITIGFLLIQDLVAMLFFIILTASQSIGDENWLNVIFALMGKMALVAIGIYILLKYIIPHVDRIFAENKEMLFIFAIGICFTIASVFYKLGFSLELGALAAGVILSVSPYQREIAVRIQSLRDFFLIIFFVFLGSNIHLSEVRQSYPLIIIFSLFVLIGNPIILILVMRWLKYTLKTSFYAGLTVSQISEFSLIIIGMGVSLGQIPSWVLGSATIVGIITITVSTYYITYNDKLYKFFYKPLHKIFPDRQRKKISQEAQEKYEVILFGSHRLGGGLVRELQKMEINYLVVDHDPEVINALTEKKVPNLYGSADDPDLLEYLPLTNTKLIISTIPELDANMTLISTIKRKHPRINLLCIANQVSDANTLYKAGATYVIMPPYLGRRFMIDLVKKNKLDHKKYKEERKKHIFDLPYIDQNMFF